MGVRVRVGVGVGIVAVAVVAVVVWLMSSAQVPDSEVLACKAWASGFTEQGVDPTVVRGARDTATGPVAPLMRTAVDHPDAMSFLAVQSRCEAIGAGFAYPK